LAVVSNEKVRFHGTSEAFKPRDDKRSFKLDLRAVRSEKAGKLKLQ